MKNPIINGWDRLSLEKDIIERDRIIEQYKLFGYLDRADAIDKIKELRATDLEVATVTAAKLAKGFIPFEQCPNNQIMQKAKEVTQQPFAGAAIFNYRTSGLPFTEKSTLFRKCPAIPF